MFKAITIATMAAMLGTSGAAFAQAQADAQTMTGEPPARRYVEVTVFGNERCPTSSNPDEIVVCRRGNADQQFRIPRELRTSANPTGNRTWGQRARGVREAGQGGPMSCSPVGPGGQSGCWARMMEDWAGERTNNNGDNVTSSVADD